MEVSVIGNSQARICRAELVYRELGFRSGLDVISGESRNSVSFCSQISRLKEIKIRCSPRSVKCEAVVSDVATFPKPDPKPRSLESVKLFVGLPLDTVSNCNNVNHMKAITAGLKALKLLGVQGVELPIFWGVVEREASGQYDWCMQRRSHRQSDSLLFFADIKAHERAISRERRTSLHSDSSTSDTSGSESEFEMGDANNAPNVARTIGTADVPSNITNRSGITPPAIANNNFEIKSSLINMVSSNKFYGLPSEDPIDHLHQFDMLCDTVKINGVNEDMFKLRLFPFSLGDKAHIWQKNLVKDTIQTWEACKTAFLTKFFSVVRTAKLRIEISAFAQKDQETFSESWERFKSYTVRCPHHGFTGESLLSTFYRGLKPKFRMLLDSASQGNFLGKTEADGQLLVENYAISDSNYGEDYDHTIRSSGNDEQFKIEIKAVNEKLDKLLMSQQAGINFVGSREEEATPLHRTHEEINYVGNQGDWRFNNYKHNPNLSYRSTNVANPQDQVYPQAQQGGYAPRPPLNTPPGYNHPPAAQGQVSSPAPQGDHTNQLLKQILEGQSRSFMEIDAIKTKVDSTYNDLNAKIESMNSHLKALDNQVAQITSASKRPIGQLPGKPEANPREYVNSIELSSDTQMLSHDLIEDNADQVGEVEQSHDSETTVLDDENTACGNEEDTEQLYRPSVSATSGRYRPPVSARNKADTSEKETGDSYRPGISATDGRYRPMSAMNKADTSEKETGDSYRPGVSVSSDRYRPPTSAKNMADTEKISEKKKKPVYVTSSYVPKLPFPGRAKMHLLKEYFRAKLEKQINEVQTPMPLVDAFKQVPHSTKSLKDTIKNKFKDSEDTVNLSQECSVIIQKSHSPKKLGDPGSFTLPCTLGPLVFEKCLCDLGASVNVMPSSVAKQLGLSSFQPTKISLVLADRSVKVPVGILEDIPVKLGDVFIPTDFVVLEIDKELNNPLIFGRPFLATAGAVIDVKVGKIDLHLGKDLVQRYNINDVVKKPTEMVPCEALVIGVEKDASNGKSSDDARSKPKAPKVEHQSPPRKFRKVHWNMSQNRVIRKLINEVKSLKKAFKKEARSARCDSDKGKHKDGGEFGVKGVKLKPPLDHKVVTE